MIPILYRSDETAFASNGLGRLADCISCTVTEERNGIYECQFSYPVSGEMYDQIQEGCIIGVIHDDVHDVQPFDIYSRSAPLNGVVTFYAHHISYRLGNVILKPMTASSCAAALAAIPANTYNQCPFTFWTDKAVSANFKNEVPSAVKAILGGQQGSILDVYGKGEYQWDKWAVKLYTNRGNDNGVSIRYGVNLTNLTHDYDISANYNAVAPYWRSTEDDTVVTLPDGYIMASNIPTGLIPWTSSTGEDMEDGNGHVIEFQTVANIAPVPMDLSDAFEEQPTVEQLRTEALRRLNNSEAWLPDENITVSFVDLAHTADYSSISALQRVSLCDKVSVYCTPLGVNAVKMQVIRVVFNVLTEMYDEIELGKAKVSFAQAVTAQVEKITKDMPTVSMMQRAIDNATDQITGANGGPVRFIYDANGEMQEILIMDTDDISTAVNVWRWNSGGFGFSSHGYAGPYATAITQDGQIVANMITTGELNANILKAGVIDGDLVKVKLLTAVDENNNVVGSFSGSVIIGRSNNKVVIDESGFSFTSYSKCVFLGNDNVDGGSEQTEIIWNAYDDRLFFQTQYYISTLLSVTVDGVDKTSECYPNGIGVSFYQPQSANIRVVIKYKTNSPIIYFTLGERNRPRGEVGYYSFAQGLDTIASGLHASAFGYSSQSNGWASHSEGYYTIANFAFQHVFGACNIPEENEQKNPKERGTYVEIVGNGRGPNARSNARRLNWNGNEWIAGTLTQASDARLKDEVGEIPDVSSIRAKRFRWNDKKGEHDYEDHIGYYAQDVEKVAPYLVHEDESGYKSLDYIALLCAKVEQLERRVAELEWR